MEEGPPRLGKRKLTRKQQLAESRRLKARYKSERDAAEFIPEASSDDEEMLDGIEEGMHDG